MSTPPNRDRPMPTTAAAADGTPTAQDCLDAVEELADLYEEAGRARTPKPSWHHLATEIRNAARRGRAVATLQPRNRPAEEGDAVTSSEADDPLARIVAEAFCRDLHGRAHPAPPCGACWGRGVGVIVQYAATIPARGVLARDDRAVAIMAAQLAADTQEWDEPGSDRNGSGDPADRPDHDEWQWRVRRALDAVSVLTPGEPT